MSEPPNRVRRRGAGAAAAALFVVLFVLPLGGRPLLLPDEFRYAEIPREMLAGGDWVVPRLDGLAYFEKPVLGYWLIGASEALFGGNRFAVRLPSALATAATALLLAFALRRAGGGETGARDGALAALVHLSSLLPAVVGAAAILDAPFALFVTATLVAFFLATTAAPSSRRERLLLLASGLACGLAFLTKGFVAVVLAALVAGGYLAWQRRWRDLLRMPWLPAAAAVAVVLPWGLAIHTRAPDFWHFFFWHEHVERFLGRHAEQHLQPWWYFLAAAPLLLLPWSFFLPAAAGARRRAGRPPAALGDLARFAVVWTAAGFLFFSASSGKLATYLLPVLPAISLLAAIGLSAPFDEKAGRTWRRGGWTGAALFAVLAAGGTAGLLGYGPAELLGPAWKGWAMVAALAAVTALLAAAARSAPGRGERPRRGPLLAAWALAPLLLTVQLALPQRALVSKAPGAFLAEQRGELPAGSVLISDANTVRAVCWSFERDDVLVLGPAGELAYGVERHPESGRAVDFAALRRLIEQHRGRVALITESEKYAGWKALLPPPRSEVSQGPRGFVFVRY